MSPWDENETKRLVQELPFYNRFIEKTKNSRFKKHRLTS